MEKIPLLSDIVKQIKNKETEDDDSDDNFDDPSLDPDIYNIPKGLDWIFDEDEKQEDSSEDIENKSDKQNNK